MTKNESAKNRATAVRVTPLGLPGVCLVESRVHADARGSFTESWQREDWQAAGITAEFLQDNLVMNEKAGTLRGLHWQVAPYAQAKAVRCLTGSLVDVVADPRPESPTFRQWIAVPLSAETGASLFVPAGYAHGYVTTADQTLVLYKVDAPWMREAERACRWNDPAFDIDWGVVEPLLSKKDAEAPFLDIQVDFCH